MSLCLYRKDDELKGIKSYFVFCTKNHSEYITSKRITRIPPRKFVSVNELFDIYRDDVVFISDIYTSASRKPEGHIKIPILGEQYKYFAVNYNPTLQLSQKGDIVASFCFSCELPDWRDKYKRKPIFNMVIRPEKSNLADLQMEFLKSFNSVEDIKQRQLEQEREEKIQNEATKREAEIQKNRQEKARLARENEAFKERLEIEKKAEEEKNRIFAERLEAQKRAMEEEQRMTREILEMRERIERQDLDATARTVESLRDLFGRK